MKKIFVLAFAFIATASAMFAQDAYRGPVATKKFGDDIFVGAGAGINTMFAPQNQNKVTGDFDIFAGKWFTPSLGLRVGFQGLSLKEQYPADFHEHFWMEPDDKGVYTYGFTNVHADAMWNILNTICGYKERVFELVPYAHVGFQTIYDPNRGMFGPARDPEFEVGPGVMGIVNITKNFGAFIDVRDNLFSGRFHNWNEGGVTQVVTAAIGVMYTFKKTDWDHACSGADLDAANASLASAREALASANTALAAALAAKEALDAKVKALADELDALRAQNTNNDDKDVVYIKTALGVPPLTLYYEINSKVLNVTERRHLDDYVKAILSQDPDRLFVLTGSADEGTGTPAINADLSAGRAAGVKKILEEVYGVKAANINVHSKISNESADPRFDRSVLIEH